MAGSEPSLVAQWGEVSLESGRKDGRRGLEARLFPGVLNKNGVKMCDNIKMKEKQTFQILNKPLRANTRWVAFWVPSSEQWLGSVGEVAVTPVGRTCGHRSKEGQGRRVSFCGSDGWRQGLDGEMMCGRGWVELSLWRGRGWWKQPGPGCGLVLSG